MENRTSPTTLLEFTAKEVDELRVAVALRIDSLYHTLGYVGDQNPSLADELDQLITCLDSIHDSLVQAYFSTKEARNENL